MKKTEEYTKKWNTIPHIYGLEELILMAIYQKQSTSLRQFLKEYPFIKELKIIFMKLIWNNRRSETVKAILGKKNQLSVSPSQTSDYTILLYTKLEQYKQCGACTKQTHISVKQNRGPSNKFTQLCLIK